MLQMKHGDSMMVHESWTGPRYHIAVEVKDEEDRKRVWTNHPAHSSSR